MKNKFNKEEVIKYLVEGKTTKEISVIYNVNIQQIQKFIRNLELPSNVYIKHRPSKAPLSNQEIDVLIGGVLGDSWIGFTKFGKHACGSFTHKIEHSEYVYYKYNILKRLCSKPKIHNKFDKRTDRYYQQQFCKIATNPLLDNIAFSFYKNGRKTVDKNYLSKLSPLAIAIWFMDDGCKTKSGYNIATDCFNKEESLLLVDLLKRFDIEATSNAKNILYIVHDSKDKFTKLIEKYVPNCMKYKLHI